MTEERSLFSVIIPTFNRPVFLKEAVERTPDAIGNYILFQDDDACIKRDYFGVALRTFQEKMD